MLKEIKSWRGSVLFSGKFKNTREMVEAAVKAGVYLSNADLSFANLFGADLSFANLSGADLSNANLSGANLFGANLEHLLKHNSVATLLTTIDWGDLSDYLTLELMRHDAESCGDESMTCWANGGACPFIDSIRDFKFIEKRELWKPGEPGLRGMALLKRLAETKGIKTGGDIA